ncbi:NifB/NifX family molybdenum-iron cluster-binding protein [Turicimonas muris]|uniref:NifB/NifX family molybdenum-iron cluster-binding protein n=4 Tax=Turicimonas muris TaxID=1796652 RepID=UPI0023F35EF9|nr:NifB/NifX family molybdenum-iron cluster-binding protein [Turicimonas muris]
MLVATPYSNDEICQHFGHAPQFKLFTVEDGKVVESVVIDTVGSGHNALATFLADHNVDIVICGGIGQGAIVSLAMAGIDIVPGVAGSPDKAVKELLEGTLVAGAVSGCGCGGHHHEENEGTCGCGGHHHEEGEGTCGCGGHHHEDTCDISGKEGKGGCGCGCH